MIITIKEKEYELKFGLKFIRELDKKHTIIQNGLAFGTGLDYVIPMLFTDDIVTLSEILYAGTCTEKVRPTQNDVDVYLETHSNIEELFEEVREELKKHNATKLKAKQMEGNLKR